MENQTGEILYKIYKRLWRFIHLTEKFFKVNSEYQKMNLSGLAMLSHNPIVSGELARHAYADKPKTENPMTFSEAKNFIQRLVNKWLASIREVNARTS